MNKPLLSVVIPVFNTQAYLYECLESVTAQSYKELQIIVVNDNSTDQSEAIIQRFMSADSRISYIKNEENIGASESRNKGIEYATGEYIGFLDSDDRLEPDAYQVMIEKLLAYQGHNHACDVVVAGFSSFTKNTVTPSYTIAEETFISDQALKYRYYYEEEAGNGWHKITSTLWNKLYRLSLFRDNQLSLPDCVGEDMALMSKILYFSDGILLLDRSLFLYRNRENSLSNSISVRHINDRFFVYNYIRQFYESKGIYADYKGVFLNDTFERLLASLASIVHMSSDGSITLLRHFLECFQQSKVTEVLGAELDEPRKKVLLAIESANLTDSQSVSELANVIDKYQFSTQFRSVDFRRKLSLLIKYALKQLGLFGVIKRLMTRIR